jgi:alkylation response protein AidB-like acyl-CoA dehydrogenase
MQEAGMAVAAIANAWVEKARALAPTVEQYRNDCERERHLVAPLFQALHEAGFFRLMLPQLFGGEQVDLIAGMRVIEELSRQDGSVGWNVMIGTHWSMCADYLPEEAARAIYTPETTLAGSLRPDGEAIPVPGGYRLSGSWGFGSGCQNAAWIGASCRVVENGAPRIGEHGPEVREFFVPASDCEIRDTWFTAGMRGTGSHDIHLRNVFVPAERSFPLPDLSRGPAQRSGIAYPRPFFFLQASPTIAAVALGIARDAIDSLVNLAGAKTPFRATTKLANQHTVHLRVGQAEALLRAARAFLYDAAQEAMTIPNEAVDTEAINANLRLASAYATQNAIAAVDLMFDSGGGSSVYATSRLERCFRDVHVVNHHIAVEPSHIEMVGQYLLGFPLQIRR